MWTAGEATAETRAATSTLKRSMPEPSHQRRHLTRMRARWRRDLPLLLMTAPAVGFLLLFHYLPTLGNFLAFKDYNPFLGDSPVQAMWLSDWVGFGNFQLLFQDPLF